MHLVAKPHGALRRAEGMQAVLSIALLRLLASLPLAGLHALGTLFGRLLYHLPTRERRKAGRNLALCFPELTPEERSALQRRTLEEFGKTLAEFSGLWLWDVERVLSLVRQVSGVSVLRAAMTRRQGVIVLGPHLGAWELTGLYLSRLGTVTHLYRPPREPGFEAFMCRARRRGGARLVAVSAPSGLRALFQALERGELVGILPDQVPRTRASAVAPFFGVPARTMLLVSRLAKRSGAAVVFGFAERLPRNQGYHLRFLPAPNGIADADPVTAASALNEGIERCVRFCPEQYQWTYRRFGKPLARQRWARGSADSKFAFGGADPQAARRLS